MFKWGMGIGVAKGSQKASSVLDFRREEGETGLIRLGHLRIGFVFAQTLLQRSYIKSCF